jgi:hypothetical protein
MKTWIGFVRKWIVAYNPGIRLERLRKITKNSSGWPVSGLSFEPRTSEIRGRIANHSTATFFIHFFELHINLILQPKINTDLGTACFLENRWLFNCSINHLFTKPYSLTLCAKKPTTGPYPKPIKNILYYFLMIWSLSSNSELVYSLEVLSPKLYIHSSFLYCSLRVMSIPSFFISWINKNKRRLKIMKLFII